MTPEEIRNVSRWELRQKPEGGYLVKAADGNIVDHDDYAKLCDAYEALRAEYEAAHSNLVHSNAEIGRLKSENERLAKNDARYRWLQSNACPGYTQSGTPWGLQCSSMELRTWEGIDAAIDAALAMEGE